MKIAIVGVGAIGSYLACKLPPTGVDLSAVSTRAARRTTVGMTAFLAPCCVGVFLFLAVAVLAMRDRPGLQTVSAEKAL